MALVRKANNSAEILDSDDWITPDATELFVYAVTENDCDMDIADFYKEIEEHVSQRGV